MRTKTVRILNIVAGILLIAAGIYCLCNEDVAVLSAGLMLGIFMLAAGIAEIVVFAGTSGVLIGSGWLLLDGVLTVIMSLFLLFNQLLYNSKDMFHFSSNGRFFALSALDLCSGSIGVVLVLGWTTIDFVMNTLTVFVSGYRFRALLGSEIAAVSVDKLLLSGKKFCHHTDVVFVGGCNFQ